MVSNFKLSDNRGNKKSVAVWLFCINGKQKGKLLLQKRAKTEIINGVKKKQSNPGICQPTWNGKLEKGEEVTAVVKREAREELGERFANVFDFSQLNLFNSKSYSFENTESISYNFLGKVTADMVALVKLHAGAERHFITIGKEDFSKIKSKNDVGANPQIEVVLFNDQYMVLKALLIKNPFDFTN